MSVNVGDRFTVNNDRPYTGPTGGGVHHIKYLVEVTEVTEFNATWKVVDVLEETDAPAGFEVMGKEITNTGGFSLRFLNDLIASGEYERITA